jgi:hypothetical protein
MNFVLTRDENTIKRVVVWISRQKERNKAKAEKCGEKEIEAKREKNKEGLKK